MCSSKKTIWPFNSRIPSQTPSPRRNPLSKTEIRADAQRLRPKKSEVERLWADNAKAKKLLEWEPKFGGADGFRKGLAKTIEWITDPSNLLTYKSDKYNI